MRDTISSQDGTGSGSSANPAPGTKREDLSENVRHANRLTWAVLALVVAKFAILLVGAAWSRLSD
ncbi:MAG: hypothetical protein AAGK00_00760 [Pseudomonadota bacterium]